MKSKLSFISANEAGEFLDFLSDTKYEGTINAASEGSITMNEIIKYIEEATNEKAIIKESGKNAAYNGMFHCNLDISKAKNLELSFKEIRDYIFNLIDRYKESITI
ncbi:hypothetical protein KPL40_11735 [Clostridium gasigenes]|uniref:hypothetical protein n=1 Tax=Clostridium gasigenes TaxID=94869 RepID=UPI001C0B27ED|nr:hypothetical protein [Clostridium gasigenes]MBU3133122.1 hypothetical protein [Clostridium gasigenes]